MLPASRVVELPADKLYCWSGDSNVALRDVSVHFGGSKGEIFVKEQLMTAFSTPSNIVSCSFATFDNTSYKNCICVLHEQGLELLFGFGAERVSVSCSFRVVQVYPLRSGVLLEAPADNSAESSLFSLLHPFDNPCPVSRLSMSGRGDVVSHHEVVCAGEDVVVTWDRNTGRHAVHIVYRAKDARTGQSYEKAVEESILAETAQSFLMNQVSLYDTFTVPALDTLTMESEVFLRRLYVEDDKITHDKPASWGVVSSDLVFLHMEGTLHCFRVSHVSSAQGFVCKALFTMDNITSVVGFEKMVKNQAFWLGCDGTSVWLFEAERRLTEIRLEGLSVGPQSTQSDSAMSLDGSSSMMVIDDDDDDEQQQQQEQQEDLASKNVLHIQACGQPFSMYAKKGYRGGVFRFPFFPVDDFVFSVLELVRDCLPGSAATDFLVDFAECANSVPTLSEWDRLAVLLWSLVGTERFDDDSLGASGSAWQRLVSSSLHVSLAQKLSPALLARVEKNGEACDRVFPPCWRNSFGLTCRTPAAVVRQSLLGMVRRVHLMYEGLKCDATFSSKLELLRPLLLVLSKRAGALRYVAHYFLDDASWFKVLDAIPVGEWSDPSASEEIPFHLFRYLIAFTHPRHDAASLAEWWCGQLPALGELHGYLRKVVELWWLLYGAPAEKEQVRVALMKRERGKRGKPGHTMHACETWSDPSLSSRNDASFDQVFESCTSVAHQCVCYLGFEFASQRSNWKLSDLAIGVAIPCHDALKQVRGNVGLNWPPLLLDLVGRTDLKLDNEPLAVSATELPLWGDPELREHEKTSGVLINDPVAYLRFPHDRRLQEAQKILATRKMVVSFPQAPGVSDHDYIREQQVVAMLVVARAGARCVGRGMLTLGVDHMKSTGAATGASSMRWELPVPSVPRSVRVTECRANVTVDETGANVGLFEWLDFHSGVAAGLRVSRDGGPLINNSWIVYNRPPDGSSSNLVHTHAGLLLGLGLNGHLNKLSFMRLFDYLARSHVMTSVGLLLGISATMMGTMDNAISKLLSVHIPQLHPPASADLEVPPSLQVASLIGLGLLFKSSCQRRMAEVFLAEMDRPPTDDKMFFRESHSFAAGVALGWLTLGQGGRAAVLDDMFIEDRLLRFVDGGGHYTETTPATDGYPFTDNAVHHSAHSYKSNIVKPGSMINVNLTAGPALLALALMYLKTNNRDVAERVRVPQTLFLLSYVRPDNLLLRCLCRSLVLWDQVQPTDDWIRSHIPDVLWKYGDFEPNQQERLEEGRNFDTAIQCRMYCLSGCLLGLGITRAGSQDAQARALILKWIRKMMAFRKSCSDSDVVFAETCVLTSCIAASLVCAGSGDLELMRLFRGLCVRSDQQVTYGSHMAASMALGFLFLGGSTYTLSTSDDAVAALVMSLFPSFPVSASDNLFHLQALRHFWVLAARPRCLSVEDAVTKELVAATATFKTSGDHLESHTTPCLAPESFSSVEVSASDYLTVSLSREVVVRQRYHVYLQPKSSVVEAEGNVSLHSFLDSGVKSAWKGWNVALLHALDKLSGKRSVTADVVKDALKGVQPLLAQHIQSNGCWPGGNDSSVLAWAMACGALPPQWALQELLKSTSSPLGLAMATQGRLSLDACKCVMNKSL